MSRRSINQTRAAERLKREADETPWKRALAVSGVKVNIVAEYGGEHFGWRITCEAAGAVGEGVSAADALDDLKAKWIASAPEALMRGYAPKEKPKTKPKSTAKMSGVRVEDDAA